MRSPKYFYIVTRIEPFSIMQGCSHWYGWSDFHGSLFHYTRSGDLRKFHEMSRGLFLCIRMHRDQRRYDGITWYLHDYINKQVLRTFLHWHKNCSYRKVRQLRSIYTLREQVLSFLELIKLRTQVLHMLRGAGFTKGMSGIRQDLYDNPIQLLLTLVSMMHIITSASLQCRVNREPACPTEQTPEVKLQDTAILPRGGRT